MDIVDKVRNVLKGAFDAEYIRLEDDDGVSGFIVARMFTGMSAFDRQTKIDEALRRDSLTREEQRHVLMIAALTPEEYDTVGARIRVRQVKEVAGGVVEIVLDGSPSDANYVRRALDNQKGIVTTGPKRVSSAVGDLMSLRAKGTEATPLTKARAIRMLKNDPYIEVAGQRRNQERD